MPTTETRDKAEKQHTPKKEKTLPRWLAVTIVIIILLAIGISGLIVFSLFN